MEVSRMGIRLHLLILLCVQVPITESTATLTILVKGFQNGFERQWDGQCCDPACSSGCDLFYRICFNDSSPQPQCLTKMYNVYITSNNTVTYHVDSWPGYLSVKVLAYDVDSGRNEFVDYFIFTLNLSSIPGPTYSTVPTFTSLTSVPSQLPTAGVTQLPGPGNSSLLVFPGMRQYFRTNLLLNAVVTCDANYYTQRCDVYCMSSSTCSGHYTCDLTTGQKICQPNWTGADCAVPSANAYCTVPPTSPPNDGIGPCQLFDLVFILDSSGSINNLDPNNWQYMKNFIKNISDRVTIGRNFFQLGVITFGDSAQMNIKLSDGYDYPNLQNKIDALPYLGQKTNLRSGLRLARTEAFLTRNGARPNAYRSVILVYDGEQPTAEFGVLANEAPRLREMGIDVSVVSLNYFFSHGLSTLDLVQNIASRPLNAHLFYDLDSWSRISNTIAPTILANLVNTCLRNIGTPGSGTGASSTVSTILPSSTTLPNGLLSSPTFQTGFLSSTALPTGLPTSSSLLTGVPSSSSFLTGFPSILPTSTNSGTGSLASVLSVTFSSSTSGTLPTSDKFCSYHGTCSSDNGINVCCCQPGYVGIQCEYEDDPCAENPCNGGACYRINRLNFTCSCLPGFSGDRCQLVGSPISACDTPSPTSAPQPQCSSIPPAPCTEFYYGPACTTFCREDNTCLGHYSCNSSGQRTCLSGWKNVSSNCTENDGYVSAECPKTCLNGGFCFSAVCCCQLGFTGEQCEVKTESSIPSSSATSAGLPSNSITPTGLPLSSAVPTGVTASLATQTGSALSSIIPTGLTASSATPTGFTAISANPTGFASTSAVPTGVTGSSATQTGSASSSFFPTGLTASSGSPTGFTAISANPTGFASTSAVPTGVTGSLATQTGSASSSFFPTGLTASSGSPTGFTAVSANPTGFASTSAVPTGVTGSLATPTGSASSSIIPTGLTASSGSPTGFTAISANPTDFMSTSAVPTGLTLNSVSTVIASAVPTGLTFSSATPTGVTASPTGVASAVPTGFTSSSAASAGLTSPRLSSSSTPTTITTTSQLGVTSLSIPSVTSSTTTTSTLTSSPASPSTAATASTSTSSTTTSSATTTTTPTTATASTSTTTGTALSSQEQLIKVLRDYIKNNFPNLSPVEQQQLLNQLLSTLTAPAALAVDDVNYLPPIYTSLPWPGSGRLANYTIQLEVLQAFVFRGENGTYQLKLKYDYILTELYTGSITRITPEEYQRLMYEVDDVPTNVSLLDPANRLQILVYGSYLNNLVRRKFTVALRNAYGQLNSAWTGKGDARIVVGEIEERIAITGEDLTLMNFWLVSGSSDSESPKSIMVPRDLSITTELSNLGVVTSLCRSVASFKVLDGYDVFVKGVVYYEDMQKFTKVLLQYWNNTVGIPSGYTIKVVKQENCSLSNGLLVTRLIYFIYNSTSFGILPKSPAFIAPRSEQLTAVMSVNNSLYELVQTADSVNALPLKQAFFITVLDHPIETTFSAIQMIIQDRIQEIPSYATAEVKVFGADEYFSVNKRISFNRILWYLFNNGTLVDGRRFLTSLPTMVEWSILLQGVKLPNGRRYRYVTDDMSEDVVVRRSECFFQPLDGIVLDVKSFEEALTMTVRNKKSELTNSASVTSVAHVEEYVNSSGSTVSVIFFVIKSPNADSYFTVLDAATTFSELISLNDLSSNMELRKRDGSECRLLNKTAVSQMTRYVSLLHLFLKQQPLTRDRDKFSAALAAYYRKKISSAVIVKVLIVEEFLDPNGFSFWGIGYSVSLDGKIVWPETIEYANSSEMAAAFNVVAATGNRYDLVSSDVESLARAKDLYSFIDTISLSTEDLKLLEKFLADAFKSGFPEYFGSVVETDIVCTEELLTPDGASIFRIYYQLYVDHWPVSAMNHDTINEHNLTSALASFATSRLWSGDINSLLKISSLSAVVMNRAMFQEDLAKLELTLRSAVALALQSTENSNGQFVLSVKRQQECITPSGSLEWSVEFSASLFGEPLYPGLLPMQLVNVSAIEFSLVSNSVIPKYHLIDISPPFLYDYEKGFRLLLKQRATSSHLSSLQTILTQGYKSVHPMSDVEVKVAAIEEVIIRISRPLIDMPSAWQVIYYVKVNGRTLIEELDQSLNASFINSVIAQSGLIGDKGELFVLDRQNLEIVRVQQCLKLLFAGMVPSSDLMTIGKDIETSLLESQGIRNISALALQRSEIFSEDGRTFTEVRVSIMQSGKAVEGNLIRKVLPSNLQLLDTYIPDPDSMLHVSLYEKSQLFSVDFKSPVIGTPARALLEKSLRQVHEELQCLNASVRIVRQSESLSQSGSSVFAIFYALMCNGIRQDAKEHNQSIYLDDLWVILSVAGFSSQLFEGNMGSLVPVDCLLGLPFTTYVSTLDYSVIEESLKQSAASLSLEFSKIDFLVLDQRTYLDKHGNFFYVVLCSALASNMVLNARDFVPLLNQTITAIEKVVGPDGSNYLVSHTDYSLLRPLQAAGVVYFDRYLTRNEESNLLYAIPKSVIDLEDKYGNLTAQIFSVDRAIYLETVHIYRYCIFLTSEVTPYGFPIDLSLEPPINATVISAALAQPARTNFPASSVRELRKSFRLNVLGYVAREDIPRFNQQLHILWNRSISACFAEEYLGVKGETVTGLSYFVLQNDEVVDPTSIRAPTESSLNSVVFAALPWYRPYTRDVFLEENAFCFLSDGDSGSAVRDWNETTGSSQAILRLLALQPAFGLYGSSFTRVCYTASSANGLLLPGRDPVPVNHSDTSETVVQADTLYNLTVRGSLTKELIFRLTQQLTRAWKNYSGCEVAVNVYGVDLQLIASPGVTLVTRTYYGVICNGSMQRPIDRLAPSMDAYLKNLSMDLYEGQTVKLRYLVLQDPRSTSNITMKLVRAVTIAWNNIPGNTVKVKIPAIPHQTYTDSLFGYVTKIYYGVTLLNDEDVDSLDSITEPNSIQLSKQLQAQGLNDCACTIWHGFYLYAEESAASLRSKLNAVSNALGKAWSDANPDKSQSEITIRVNLNGGRKKRTTNNLQYEDVDGNLLSPFLYQVAVRNRDPDPLFIQFPNDSTVALSLSEVAGMSVCTSCALQQCGDLYISGMLQELDKVFLEQAIANAFASANQPDFSPTDFEVILKSVAIVKDSTGADVSRVSYCVHWTTNSTLPQLNIPSYDQMSKALTPYKMIQVDPSMITSGEEKSLNNTQVAIIVACCVGGFLLLAIAALIIGRIIYQKRKLAVIPPDQDKQNLSISDGDSFVGHGLYNPSPYNSLHNKASGTVLSKLQFRDSTMSEIST